MGFKKGQSGNAKGRPKGAKSKAKITYNMMLDLVISGQFEKLKTELCLLHGNDYVNAIIKLGRIVNKNNNYSDTNELLTDIIKKVIKLNKNESIKTS